MTLRRLEHVFPQWEFDPDSREERLVWTGRMRIIGRQRARKLRRRGVPIMRKVEVTANGRHRHAWFVE